LNLLVTICQPPETNSSHVSQAHSIECSLEFLSWAGSPNSLA